jgi:hypothetical protein
MTMVTQILLIGMNGWLLFNVQIAVAVKKNIFNEFGSWIT